MENATLDKLPGNSTLNIQAFEQMLELKMLTNSYKLYWFSALFEEIILGQNEITFRKLVIGMVVHSWYSILAYKIELGINDKLKILVKNIHEEFSLPVDISKNDLINFLVKKNLGKIEEQLKKFYKYVPYRLLTPFYDFSKFKLKDKDKNNFIEKVSQKKNSSLYKIITNKEKIILHPEWFQYIFENQTIIRGWLNYKLIYFLQKRNPNMPSIPFKLNPPGNRDLSKAKNFWGEIISIIPVSDIYSGKLLHKDKISIDHFIPWSFVLHDKLWNLIPTTKNINSSKNDKLPIINNTFDNFCQLHFKAYTTAIKHGFNKKLLEDYLDLLHINEIKLFQENIFINAIKETILPLHQLARNSGFMIWNSTQYKF